MELLLELTVGGSIAVLLVGALDRCLAARVSARSRRWWWLLVPAAFLIPFRLPLLPASFLAPTMAASWIEALPDPTGRPFPAFAAHSRWTWAVILWAAGACGYAAVVAIQTIRASRRWSRERLSTDPALLRLLEDCKAEAGVTAPIGLVISPSVSSPSILGWLRPRILLPTAVAADPADLRPILLHELAHFRWLDVPFQWLLAAARTLHWFNPFVHAGAIAWSRFREEAADESAVLWLRDPSGQRYGAALLRLLRECQPAIAPRGALAIVETGRGWKRRIALINRFPQKSPRVLLAAAVMLLAGALAFAGTAAPAGERAALREVQRWLGEIDRGDFGGSWEEMDSRTQAKIGREPWIAALEKAREPIGRCERRQTISISVEKDPRWPEGVFPGLYYEVTFKSSFERLSYAGENVMVSERPDGSWKICAYSIHP